MKIAKPSETARGGAACQPCMGASRDNQVMAEASIDGMAFFDEATAGGAFRLSEAASEDSIERIGAWTIEIRAGSEIVVARGDGGSTYEEARDDALAAANKGLDLLCLRGGKPVAIRHAGTEHIVWWSAGARSVIRLLTVPTVTLHVGEARVTGGKLVVPPPPEQAGERQVLPTVPTHRRSVRLVPESLPRAGVDPRLPRAAAHRPASGARG
jgi:hypothetical protein